MNNKKRGLALSIMAGVAMLLSACGDSDSNESASSHSSGASAGSKPVELVMTYPAFGDVSDLESVQGAINELAAAKIGATVKLVPIGVSNYAQQINLMLAGNEKLDLLYASVWFGMDSQVAKKQLAPLDDLIRQYGSGITDSVDAEFLEAGKVNGKQYGIPSNKAYSLTPSLVMRKDIADKYGITEASVSGIGDIGPLLATIKAKEPSIVPLVSYSLSETPVNQMLYGDPMGITPGSVPFGSSDLKLQDVYESKDYADRVAIVNKWYEAGYLSKDVATTQESGPSLLKAGKGFAFIRNINDCYSEQLSAGTEVICAPLNAPYITRNSVASNLMSISQNSKNPEMAMKFLNLLYTDKDIVNLFTNGIEGKHYVKSGDAVIAKPAGQTGTGYDSNQTVVGNNFLSYVWEGTDPNIWTATKERNANAVKSQAMGFSFDMDAVKNEITAVSNVSNQYSLFLETGVSPPEKLQEFVGKLKDAGIEKIIAEKQKQLDEWLKL
ncbi:ABC transporter substrate-binding protein [Cohnella hashimotonis]|uniref:ABC transporter substrate-binding protein n=1 Tax=Cohnella hashimotonis TaxID=2826895 RepID=A0ABT6T9N0_9BACL|nr:ABC transporter substrate-binding protein [Cohnella hashimotonis]MDI4643534.1 ABC transporter substrate-binding protein [Cohnella hashimotonis]